MSTTVVYPKGVEYTVAVDVVKLAVMVLNIFTAEAMIFPLSFQSQYIRC
jgi:hypothetical protein